MKLQVEDELKDYIGRTQLERYLEEISSGIQKFENGLLDHEIELVKFGDHKLDIVELKGVWLSLRGVAKAGISPKIGGQDREAFIKSLGKTWLTC